MSSYQIQKKLIEELNKHRIDISKLRNSLNELDKEKELWFKKMEEFSRKIKEYIQKIKDYKQKRDELTREVKEFKSKRDGINREITPKLKELGKLKKEKISIAKSLNIKDSPSTINQNIEKLEFKIETEVISFDKEREIMKKIKELKKLYDGASILDDANKRIDETSILFRDLNKKSNEAHKLVQEKAKESQALHEEILKTSSDIDKIKVDEEGAFKKFSELKEKFNETNAQLKEKLKSVNEAKNSLDKIVLEKKEKRRMEQESFLKSKEEQVNEKIKRGEKLTTEDLLVFQKFGKE